MKEDHHLIRGRVQPDESLLSMIYPWLEAEFDDLQGHLDETGEEKQTAFAFLLMLYRQRRIILKDAAALLVEDNDRRDNWLFELPVFKSELFGNFVEEMRAALSEETTTANSRALIDRALTGMNSRFDSLERRLQSHTKELAETMKDVMTDMTEKSKEEIRNDIAQHLAEAAERIQHSSTQREEAITVAASEEAITMTQMAAGFGHLLTKGHCPSDNVQMIWNEWNGLAEFSGIPVDGGIAAMEERYGSKWRQLNKYYTAAQQKHFSRVSQIVKGIQRRVNEGEELTDVCRDLTQVFSKGAKGSDLAGTVRYLQEHGWLEVSKRKRRD